MPDGRDEVLALLALGKAEGIGPERLHRLAAYFATAQAVLEAADWEAVIQGPPAYRRPGRAEFEWARSQWSRLKAEGGRCYVPGDGHYPELLHQIPSPPPLLFALGPDDLAGPTVAIVGPRKCSDYGLQVAGELAGELALRGICVVSGMAYGVDGAAHAAALRAGGRTIAALGCGADVPYPRAHTALYRGIREHGAIVSEFAWGAQPNKGSFPQRNRIISGLSLGVIVVEAPQKSGSLITVKHALDQNREVFAVPGDVRTGRNTGCHQLIRDGAKLVEGVDDVLEELAHWVVPVHESMPTPVLPPEDERVYGLLSRNPRHIDELAQDSTLAPQALLDSLLRLELDGFVDQLSGKRFLRRIG